MSKLSTTLRKDLEKYYLSNISPNDIIESLDLDREQINEFGLMIYGEDKSGQSSECLWQKRAKNLEENPDVLSVANYRVVKGHIIDNVQSSILTKIKKKLDSLSEQDIESIADAKILLDMFTSLDKIGRLERGESTENINIDSGMTLRDIHNGIPMEAKYEHINKESDEEDNEGIDEIDYSPAKGDTSSRTLPNGVRL